MSAAATTGELSLGVAKAPRTPLEEVRTEVDELAAARAELEQVRAQFYGVLEGARAAFSAENGVIRALAGAGQIDEVADSVLEVLCEAFEFDVASFWMLDPDDNKLFVIAHRRSPTRRGHFIEAEVRKLQLAPNDGVAGRVFVERREFLGDDVISVSHPAVASLLGPDDLNTVCAFPISDRDGAPLGVIEMERREPLGADHAINTAVRVIGERLGAFIEFNQMRWRYFALVDDLKRDSQRKQERTQEKAAEGAEVISFRLAA